MIQFAPEPSGPAAFEAFLLRLLEADWQDPQGPLRLSQSLTLADLASSTFFQNTRTLLTALAESNGTPATATGSLTRVFVRQMFDRIILPKAIRESTLFVCKVLNERDVWPLHIARIVAECAGLITRRNQRFRLTQSGRELLPEAQAGVLFRKLFVAYFRKFDLHYDFNLRDVPLIQQTIPVILWRLDRVARDLVSVRGLAPDLLLPGVLTQLHQAMKHSLDTEEWILAGYVLEPLRDLGLLERKRRSAWLNITEKDHLRVTPLWQKFISVQNIG